MCRCSAAVIITSLPDAVKMLAASTDAKDTIVLDVRRTHIMKDAMKEASKPKFKPTKLVKVIRGLLFGGINWSHM